MRSERTEVDSTLAGATSLDSWKRTEAVLGQVLELESAVREQEIDRLCAGDRELAASVRAYLAREAKLQGFLEKGPLQLEQALSQDRSNSLLPGARLGPYRVLRELGRGGMSLVYLAARDDQQFRQNVAIKVIRPDLDAERWQQHFVRERQILAELQHPDIARLYDGGTTPEGMPYLVMEKVDGRPIDDYCQVKRLALCERIKLFRQVCAAVMHAHQQRVVHRDLKPANILVTAVGRPKLLDFGIAELLEPTITERDDEQARDPFPLMTPGYASPEQIEGCQPTAASDVYSLGVVLYRLISGRLPHALSGQTPAELLRTLHQVLPANPSRYRDPHLKSRRGRQQVRLDLRDLDAIALKAIRADPAGRYPSVQALDEDLDRLLAGRPVRARHGNWLYLGRKALRRNALLTSVSSTVLVALLTFALQAWISNSRLTREQQQTREVADFAIGLFTLPEHGVAGGDADTNRELLERGAARLANSFGTHPELRATLEQTVGRAYTQLGMPCDALSLLRSSVERQERALGSNHPRVAEGLHHLGIAEFQAGHFAASEHYHRLALDLNQQANRSTQASADLEALAELLRLRGGLATAERMSREALQQRRTHFGPQSREAAVAQGTLARILTARGQYEKAEGLLRHALSIYQQNGWRDLEQADLSQDLGRVLLQTGQVDQAEALFEETLTLRRRRLGEEHPLTVDSAGDIASVLVARGQLPAAEAMIRQQRQALRAHYGSRNPRTALATYRLAQVLHEQKRSEEAEKLLRGLLQASSSTLDENHPWTAKLRTSLAAVLLDLERREETRDQMTRSL